jgi:hypothetical protein
MRLRFTIRDLLWLTLVVALAAGWWIDHKRLVRLMEFDTLPPILVPLSAPYDSPPLERPILQVPITDQRA